jgi:hypothetical protein
MKFTHIEHVDVNENRETNNERPRRDAYFYSHERRSSRAERIRTDGGRFILPNQGEVVADRDTKVRDQLLVVNVRPHTTAADEHIPEINATVAEVNDIHSSAAPVAECVYVADIHDTLGEDYSLGEVCAAIEEDPTLRSYTFPVDRLGRLRRDEK